MARRSVIVIGAGAFGGWAALQLLRAGAQVTLVDRWGGGNSRASSGGETRVIRNVYGADAIYADFVHRSFEMWNSFQRKCGLQVLFPSPVLWLFPDDDSYGRASVPILARHGYSLDELTIDVASRRYPQINFGEINSVFLEQTAGYLLARQACGRVTELFVKEGGTCLERWARPAVSNQSELREIELDDGTRLQADDFVFACGPWIAECFPDLMMPVISVTRQDVFYFGTPVDDSRYDEGVMPIWLELGERVFYGIPGSRSRGFKIADDTRGESFEPTSGDRETKPESLARARQYMAHRFPGLADAPLLETRVCQYSNSPDGHHVIDHHPSLSNCIIMAGGAGHGYKVGPGLGQHVADHLMNDVPLDPAFGFHRLENQQSIRTQFSPKN